MSTHGTYTLGIRGHFDAAHFLRGYEGKCAQLHGHRWEVEVQIEGSSLDTCGMLMDFGAVKFSLETLLEGIDHGLLNDREPFSTLNPTAENIARELYKALKEKIPEGISLVHVKVWESPQAWAAYSEAPLQNGALT
ncbi:MAG: 6-carboxytetrahydropterin synthase QueD [Candidatus Eremiobacteraeota bacterium]|nr:6-carboxytetrahydropterin synthase QueD [Candidatus Eremiobacteraeota bacterium]